MWWRRLRYALLLVAMCAIATCPAAKRSCTAQSRAREAEDLASYLVERIAAAIAATGRVPATPAGPTPTPSCCEQDGECAADPAAWSTPGWKALGFSVDGAHRYTYAYVPDPGGRSAIVRVTGDQDCDGETALYEVEVRISAGGVERVWTRKNPLE